MIFVDDCIYLGRAEDERRAMKREIDAVLNVARDLNPVRGWPTTEYLHIGLIDGPGNRPAMYGAAVLALAALVADGRRTLVVSHDLGRPVAVTIFFLRAMMPSAKRGWDGWLTALRERTETELPVPHEAHKQMFETIDWRALSRAMAAVKTAAG